MELHGFYLQLKALCKRCVYGFTPVLLLGSCSVDPDHAMLIQANILEALLLWVTCNPPFRFSVSPLPAFCFPFKDLLLQRMQAVL